MNVLVINLIDFIVQNVGNMLSYQAFEQIVYLELVHEEKVQICQFNILSLLHLFIKEIASLMNRLIINHILGHLTGFVRRTMVNAI